MNSQKWHGLEGAVVAFADGTGVVASNKNKQSNLSLYNIQHTVQFVHIRTLHILPSIFRLLVLSYFLGGR